MFRFSPWTALSVTAAYVLASETALQLLRVSGATPLLSLASGVALAAFILRGLDALPGVWLGALICVVMSRQSLLLALLVSSLVVMQTMIAWWLLSHGAKVNHSLERVRDVLLLIVIGATFIPVTSALASIVDMYLHPQTVTEEGHVLIQVATLGEALGIILLVPPILAWAQHFRSRAAAPTTESWTLYAVTIAVSIIVFSGQLAPAMNAQSLPYALFPVTFWAALRLGIRDTGTALLLCAAIAVGYHSKGMGPFVMPSDSASQTLVQCASLYLFLVVLSVTSLLAAAAQAERTTAELQARISDDRARTHLTQLAHVSRVASMGEMASAIAHEINQPLTAITNYANASLRLLKSGSLSSAEVCDTMQRLATEAERAGAVVRKMREFVRAEEANPARVEIDELFADVLRLTRAEARQYDVDVSATSARGLPAILVDAVQVQQVLLNLVRNALEAIGATQTKERRVVLSATLNAARMIEIEVRDSGPGLDAATAQKIFEPFYTTKIEGLGIGLALSRSIADAHGGRLWAVPNQPDGIFRLTLPLAEDA